MKNESVIFLRQNIIGKILQTDEVTYQLEEGKIEGIYSDKMIFSDLTESENRLQFHMTTISNEQMYSKNDKGERTGTVKDFTGTSVFRYELALRKSTGQMTGFVRCLSSTVSEHTMEAVVYGVYDIRFEENELRWKEQQLLYRDSPAGEGKFRPIAFDSEVRFYMENGKVVFEYIPTFWDIQPDTLHKTLSKEKYPTYISKEK